METLLGCALQGVKSHHGWRLDFTQPSHAPKELGVLLSPLSRG